MLSLLWLIPALPLAGFLILALFGRRMSKKRVALTGTGSVGLSALLTLLAGIELLNRPADSGFHVQTLWTWMQAGAFYPQISFHLDALSLLMAFVVTLVGFLIHVYSVEFMRREEGFSRFFAYMNLFVGSMLILVLADNLLLLYLGWEGVGLCSYLLIGFWYRDPANGRAARKAFIVTRIGDTAMALGLFLLFRELGTLHIQQLLETAPEQWSSGSANATLAAALLLGGAVGKSAQLPLQTWLPDAMAGPTPVSALIHAATMVTAGVYLIARTHVIFELAPAVQAAVAVIGALTLLLAGFSALAQRDIKRILAYSTISQIGYMFLALGSGAFAAAMFHFMTHAFFKALLFLAAGAIIHTLHHEHDIYRMGGLRRHLPQTFWTFLIGSASLAALPLVTAGFYSKDMILFMAWGSERGSPWLWAAGTAGAFLTALYTFRMVFLTFFGETRQKPEKRPGLILRFPLVILAVFSLLAGFVETPHTLGHITLLSDRLHTVLPAAATTDAGTGTEAMLQIIAAAVTLSGIYLAYRRYYGKPAEPEVLETRRLSPGMPSLWYEGWGFDRAYGMLFVRPYMWFARMNRADAVDLVFQGIVSTMRVLYTLLVRTQTGKVRTYAAVFVAGAVVIVTGVVIWL